jgi:TolB-like protein
MGERTIDGRSDQYSLACVAYELLAGNPPFTASTMQGLVARHMAEQVPLITTVRHAVPDEVQDVILQALEKVPADRFATIGQFAEALAEAGSMTTTVTRRKLTPSRTARYTSQSNRVARRAEPPWWRSRRFAATGSVIALVALATVALAWRRTHASAAEANGVVGFDPKRIAVLYFADESRSHQLGPLAAGLTESLIDRLNQVQKLDVISKNGVKSFHSGSVDADSVARVLTAGTIVRGSVDTANARVHVEVHLVDGNSGTAFKNASFSRPVADLVALQDSLAAEVAGFLRVRLGEEVRLRERRASTRSTDAWLLYQRAERIRGDADSLARSGKTADGIAALSRADSVLAATEAADRTWLEPVVTRGWLAYRRSQLESGSNAAPWLDTALTHATRALQRAPTNPDALALRGTVHYQQWQLRLNPDPPALAALLQSARRDLETAVAADPSLARANITLSYLYYQTDDVPGALLAARHAYQEDAYLEDADKTLLRLFWGSLDLEQFTEARRWCGEGARRFPRNYTFVQCQIWLMATPAVPAEPSRDWHLLALLDTLAPAAQRPFVMAQARLLVAGALARAGLVDSARSVLRTARQGVSQDADPTQTLLSQEAYVRTLTNEPDIAIGLLKQYVAANPGHEFLQQAGTVWWWRDLRTNPRWREIGHTGR